MTSSIVELVDCPATLGLLLEVPQALPTAHTVRGFADKERIEGDRIGVL